MTEQTKEVLDGDQKEGWMNSKWRPMMGWMYMVVCMMDFVVFPILWSLLQAMNNGRVETQWSPITLQGAGLFHMAMGAIIGVAAFGRTQEKLAGANNGGLTSSSSGFTAPSAPPTGFGTSSGSFGSPVPSSSSGSGFGGTPPTTSNGKKIVPDVSQPEI